MGADLKQLRKFAEHALAVGGDWLAVFHGAANPQAVLALLDDNESLRSQLAAAKAEIERLTEFPIRLRKQYPHLSSELDRFAGAVDRDARWRADLERQLSAMTAARDDLAEIATNFTRPEQITEAASRHIGRRIATLRSIGSTKKGGEHE